MYKVKKINVESYAADIEKLLNDADKDGYDLFDMYIVKNNFIFIFVEADE